MALTRREFGKIALAGLPARDVCIQLSSALQRYQGNVAQDDDTTLLAIHRSAA